MSTITITVRGTTARGFVRPLTFAEEVTEATRTAGKVTDHLFWPVPVPEYGTGDAADKRRKRNYGDAVGQAQGLAKHVAFRLAKGKDVRMHIIVESGACLTSERDANDRVVRWGNVVAPSILADMANFPGTEVTVAAGADDPRDYVEDSDA